MNASGTVLCFTRISQEKHAIYLAVVGMGPTPHHLSANTILMAPSLSSLLVFLFCMWQIEALPREASMVGEGGEPFSTTTKKGMVSFFHAYVVVYCM
jgi:hypothetical protein